MRCKIIAIVCVLFALGALDGCDEFVNVVVIRNDCAFPIMFTVTDERAGMLQAATSISLDPRGVKVLDPNGRYRAIWVLAAAASDSPVRGVRVELKATSRTAENGRSNFAFRDCDRVSNAL